MRGCMLRLTRKPLLLPSISHCDDVSLEETLRAELGQLPGGTFARMRRTPYVLEPCGLRKDRRRYRGLPMTQFRGSITALVTPFKDGAVDEAAFRSFINW